MRRMILAAGAAILLAPIWAAHAECPFFSDAKLNAMFVQHPFVNNPGLEAVLVGATGELEYQGTDPAMARETSDVCMGYVNYNTKFGPMGWQIVIRLHPSTHTVTVSAYNVL